MKTVKVFPLESFALYGTLSIFLVYIFFTVLRILQHTIALQTHSRCYCILGIVCEKKLSRYVTRFGKTDHIVTIDISNNTDLKY